MSLQRLAFLLVWCALDAASGSTVKGATHQPRYPAFPTQFTANYTDNYGASAQVFVASTRSATGRFLARIKYVMVLKQVELPAVYSHAFMYTAPKDAVNTSRVYNRTLSLLYRTLPGEQQECFYNVGRVPEMFSPMGTGALMIGQSDGECMGLTVCDGMNYNGTVMRNGIKTDVWFQALGTLDNVTVYSDANTGIPYESVRNHQGGGTFDPSRHIVAHTIITPGMPKDPIQLPQEWQYNCGDDNRGINSSEGTRGAFVTTPRGYTVISFNLFDTPLRGNTTLTLTVSPTSYANCTDCVEMDQNRLVFTPNNYTQIQDVKLIYKKDGVTSVDVQASGGYYDKEHSGFVVCACAGGVTGVTCHAPLFNICP